MHPVPRGSPGVGPSRRFWMVLAVAATLITIGDTVQAVLTIGDPVPARLSGGAAQTVALVLALALLTVVMLTYAPRPRSARERLRLWLDSATVLVGGAVLMWTFAVDPAVTDPGRLFAALSGTAFVLVTLFAAVRIVLSRYAPTTRLSAAPMLAAMAVHRVTAFLTPAEPTGDRSTGVFLAHLLPSVLVAVGPRIQALQAQHNPEKFAPRAEKPYSALPYVAITATFAALIIVLPAGTTARAWGALCGAVAITGLVVARQLLAFHDNIELINQLDGALLELREHEHRLREQASTDSLTRLLNRAALTERVALALADPPASRPGEAAGAGTSALLLVDLDDFKTINDTLGHAVGDSLLISVAERLVAAIRPGDVVARLGGDEFAVLLHGVGPDRADGAARRILAGLSEPVSVRGQALLVHASIGAAVAGPGSDLDSLLRDADIALYEAKDRGKGGAVRFRPDMGARLFETAELGARLREAIDEGQLHLVYQPIVELDTGRVVATEALVRWSRPGAGTVSPAQFIPAAERTGLIVPLGRFVLREATRQAARWMRQFGAAAPASVSVNVAGRQLQEPGFVQEVAGALATVGLAADRLTIEVTETAMLVGGDVTDTLHQLRDLGVRLALDDFGTAASSLGLLLTCPVTALKLDRSFVEGVTTVNRQAAVATAVVQIAQALDLDAVAEGVETAEQAALLSRLGYRLAQGYHFSRPAPPEELTARWSSRSAAPAGAARR